MDTSQNFYNRLSGITYTGQWQWWKDVVEEGRECFSDKEEFLDLLREKFFPEETIFVAETLWGIEELCENARAEDI